MEDVGFWERLLRDLSGPGRLRLIAQPTLAVLLGIRIGIADARGHQKPFGARLLHASRERWKLILQSFLHAAIPLVIALTLDAVLQYLARGRIRPLQAVVVGLLLVWLPFTMARGFTNRVWRRRRQHSP